jgi:hypothetical protein
LNLLWAYTAFYNPVNTLRSLFMLRGDSVSWKRVAFQIIGQIGLALTIPKMLWWARRLRCGPIEVWDGLQQARIPMVAADSRREINWAIEHLPTPDLPAMSTTHAHATDVAGDGKAYPTPDPVCA